ncbi:MAG TPA: FAD-dependent oxidoreductase, partial [Xanthomonadales bacterium]|nr:FAD-dependent oxidoreductase [Xanthomonadales bacterium]
MESLVPLWQRTAPTMPTGARDGPPLADVVADLVVVGAGVIGTSCALHAAERGLRVLLLERYAVGAGSTGRANGQILAGLQKDPDEIVAAYGRECGEQVVAFSGGAPARVFELVAR